MPRHSGRKPFRVRSQAKAESISGYPFGGAEVWRMRFVILGRTDKYGNSLSGSSLPLRASYGNKAWSRGSILRGAKLLVGGNPYEAGWDWREGWLPAAHFQHAPPVSYPWGLTRAR